MIAIRGNTGEFVLDMNDECKEVYEFRVVSVDDGGRQLYWAVDYSSSDGIVGTKKGSTILRIKIDAEKIRKNEFLYIVNGKNETLLILVVPNKDVIAPKTYVFDANVSTDGILVYADMVSTVNGKDAPWSCTYDGRPCSFNITPSSGIGSTYVSIGLTSKLFSGVSPVIEFTQEKSGKRIRLYLSFTVDGLASVTEVKSF